MANHLTLTLLPLKNLTPFFHLPEPNLLNHTAHSVARKGVKKRDLSDVELREILCELLPLVRVDHVLPPNSEILSQVSKFFASTHVVKENPMKTLILLYNPTGYQERPSEFPTKSHDRG